MTDWNYINRIEPKAIAYAVDAAGMQCCFTAGAVFVANARVWTPVGGRKVGLGLMGISSHFEPSGTLEIKPGCEAAFREAMGASAVGKAGVPGASPLQTKPSTVSIEKAEVIGVPADLEEKLASSFSNTPSSIPNESTEVVKAMADLILGIYDFCGASTFTANALSQLEKLRAFLKQ